MCCGNLDGRKVKCQSFACKLLVKNTDKHLACLKCMLAVTPTDTRSQGGGTLKNSVYIGEADFFGVKILNFRIFLGFQKN